MPNGYPFNSVVVREGVELAEEAADYPEKAEQEMLDRQAMADEENPPKDPNVKDPSEFGAKENFQEVGDVIGGIGKDLIADTAFLPQSLSNLATGRRWISLNTGILLGLSEWQDFAKD